MKKLLSRLCLVSIVVFLVLVMGCIGSSGNLNSPSLPGYPEPETGIAYWIKAVNEKDVARLYSLSPEYIRHNVSKNDFVALNANNPLLKPGSQITDMEVLNKTGDNNSAMIKAMLVQSSENASIPIWYNFTLSFEDGEWKVWTAPF
jgi:hypothetical protein